MKWKFQMSFLFRVLCVLLALMLTGCGPQTSIPDVTESFNDTEDMSSEANNDMNTINIYATTPNGVEITGSEEFTVLRPEDNGGTVSVTKYGINTNNTGTENTAAMKILLDSVLEYNKSKKNEKKVTKINFSTGTYRFGGDFANQISVVGFDNIIIEGNGSTLLFEEHTKVQSGNYFYFEKCNIVEIRNMTLKWDWDTVPLFLIGEVSAIDAEKKQVEFTIQGDWNIPETFAVQNTRPWDIEKNCRDDDIGFSRTAGVDQIGIKKSADNKILVTFPSTKDPSKAKLGQGLMFYVLPNMRANAFKVYDSNHFTMDNVTVESVHYEILNTLKTQYIQVLNCTVQTEKDSGKRLTSIGGFEIHSTGGYFRMENCLLDGIADDNIHLSNHFFGGENVKIDSNTVKMLGLSNWSANDMLYAGARLEIRDENFKKTGWESVITEVVREFTDSGVEFTVAFADPLPADYNSSLYFWNMDGNVGNFIIRNNTFQNGPCASLSLGLPNGTVEGNRFYNVGCSAIILATYHRWGKWYLGSPVSNVVIRNNIIENCNLAKHDISSIFIGAGYDYVPSDFYPVNWPMIDRILVEGNVLEENYGSALMIFSSREVIVKNNSFINSNLRAVNRRFLGQGNVSFTYVSDLWYENNVLENTEASLEDGVWFDSESCEDVDIKNKKGGD